MGQEEVLVDKSVWTHTYTGERCYPLLPEENVYRIEDIAHALSNVCRYGGHTKYHYSVAQHCLAMAALCTDKKSKLYALLHDATEAYLGDIPRPLKNSGFYKEYKLVELAMSNAIYSSFGLSPEVPWIIGHLDHNIVRNEAMYVFDTEPTWTQEFELLAADPRLFARQDPVVVERKYLELFRSLYVEAVAEGL
jgi:uncharacterized protein